MPQALCLQAGLEDTPTVLYLPEHQILDEKMLLDVSNLLSGLDIPGLIAPEDATRITVALQDRVTATGTSASRVRALCIEPC